MHPRALLLVLLAVVLVAAPAGAQGRRWEMTLVLHDSLFPVSPAQGSKSLLLDVRRQGGQWQRLWGDASSFNKSHPQGRVVSGEVTDETVTLEIEMAIGSDAWVKGGRLHYTVKLHRQDDGTWTGRYEGWFKGVEHAGRATGKVKPPYPRIEGAAPAGMDEHPRILFGKADLPALRQRARTPLGRAALAKAANTPAGQGMLYQLTGDKAHAEKSRALLEPMLADMDNGSKMIRSRIWGWRLEQMGLAFDLCYDAWDDAFKKKVAEHVLYTGRRLHYAKNLFHREISWNLASTYPGQILYGSAIASLAIWGEKGPAPARPNPPASGTKIPPVAADQLGKAPVVAFQDGKLPAKWIFAGGFKVDDPAAPFDGGLARARPQPGQALTAGDQTDTFQPLGKKAYWSHGGWTGGQTNIDITAANGRAYFTTNYFYTVIRNDRPRWVRLGLGHGGATCHLGGQAVKPADVVHLDKGLYPMLVAVTIGETNPWGKIYFRPHLQALDDDEAAAAVAHRQEVYRQKLADWQFDTAQWQATGGANVAYIKLMELNRMTMYRLVRETINDGGFPGSTSSDAAMEGPNRYCLAHRNVFGLDLSPYPDATHMLPAAYCSWVFRDKDEPLAIDINGSPALWWDAYHEKHNLESEYFASMYPLIPDAYKPAMLWVWKDRLHLGGADAQTQARLLLAGPKRPYDYGSYDTHPLYVFLNYPLQARAVHPRQGMPRTWASPGYGYYMMRNGWTGRNDIVAQVYFKARQVGGRDNAGTLRLLGFGQTFSHGWSEPGGYRFGENVVLLPGRKTYEAGCGRVVYAKLEDDGSGVVSADMSELYQTPKTNAKGKPVEVYERMGDIRNAGALQDTALRSIRSIGVDYSGKSGAPCLIAIVDKFDGPRTEKLWAWQLESSRTGVGRAEKDKKTGKITWRGKQYDYDVGQILATEHKTIKEPDQAGVSGQTFVIPRGDSKLVGRVITPARARIEFASRSVWTQGFKASVARTTSRAVFVESDGSFFVVMTLQKGDAPEVTVTGSGLDAKVTVGGQTVRFDGTKIVFGD